MLGQAKCLPTLAPYLMHRPKGGIDLYRVVSALLPHFRWLAEEIIPLARAARGLAAVSQQPQCLHL